MSSCRQLEARGDYFVKGGKDERAKRGVSLIQNLEHGVTMVSNALEAIDLKSPPRLSRLHQN